jgi:hypothetical protein
VGGKRAVERDSELWRTIERLLRIPDNLAAWQCHAPSNLDRKCESLYERMAAEFNSVTGADSKSLSGRAERSSLPRREPAVGEVSPEVDGLDPNGRKLSMSDYKWQVVVLTFLFSSCAPCKAMYLHERELVAKLNSKPFALRSVNVEEDVRTLRESIASGEVTSRCWWDGGAGRPIATRWCIRYYPTVCMLVRVGVIRFKDVQSRDLDTAVASLLAEPAAAESSHQ